MPARLILMLLGLVVVCLGVLLFFPFSTCAEMDEEEATRLVYRFEKGDVRQYRLVTESDQRQDVGPFQRSVRETVFTQKVIDVTEDVATLEIVYDSVRVDLQAGPVSFSYDSRTGEGSIDDVQKKIFSALLGRPCRVRMKQDGTVLDVSGFDEPFEQIASELGGNPFTEQIVAAQQEAFGNEAMKETFRNTFLKLPDRALEVGTKWSDRETMSHPIGVLEVRSSNRLDGTAEEVLGYRCAKIVQTSTASLTEPKPARFGEAVFEHALESASLSATHFVAEEPGLLVRSESQVEMNLRVTPQLSGGQEPPPFLPKSIGVTSVTKVVLELIP